MKISIFDEKTKNLINDESACISSNDAYVGDRIYKISFYRESEKSSAVFACVKENDKVVSIKDVRSNLDGYTAGKAVGDLEKRIEDLVMNDRLILTLVGGELPEESENDADAETAETSGNASATNTAEASETVKAETGSESEADTSDDLVLEEGESASAVKKAAEEFELDTKKVVDYPLVFKVRPAGVIFKDAGMYKAMSSEINDWLDSLLVLKSLKADDEEQLKKEYQMILESSYLPKKGEDAELRKDYSNVMMIITVVLTALSIFAINDYDYVFLPLMGLISGIFSDMRGYVSKNQRVMLVCTVCILVCAYIVFRDFGLMKTQYQGVRF